MSSSFLLTSPAPKLTSNPLGNYTLNKVKLLVSGIILEGREGGRGGGQHFIPYAKIN